MAAFVNLEKQVKNQIKRGRTIMRMLMLTLATTVVTAGVIMNVYSKKKQFYPSVTYLFKSSRCMSVCIYNYNTQPYIYFSLSLLSQVFYIQAFLIVWQLVKFFKFLFFGTLRAIEVEVSNHTPRRTHSPPHPMQHLIERSWFAVLDTFILLAAFHEELSPTFVSLIVLVFIMKSFHCLASDRVDHVSQSHDSHVT